MTPLGLDHVVLTVASLETSIRFYRDVLGFEEITFAKGRKAVQIGFQKINFHVAGAEFAPHSKVPTPGSGDICIIFEGGIEAILENLTQAGVSIELGPVDRNGAMGLISSVYIRDPDGNLVELGVYSSGSLGSPSFFGTHSL